MLNAGERQKIEKAIKSNIYGSNRFFKKIFLDRTQFKEIFDYCLIVRQLTH